MADTIERVIGLKYPFLISKTVHYPDFGSHGMEIKGAMGTNFAFSFRGGGIIPNDPRDQSWRAPKPMYVGALHPDYRGARPVVIGGREEAAVRDALTIAIRRALPGLRREMERRGLTDTLILRAGRSRGRFYEKWERVWDARQVAERLDRRVRLGPTSDSLRI